MLDSSAKRRVITQEKYNRLLEAFRTRPGKIMYASRVAGVDRRTARRAWSKGWPTLPPIEQVLDHEREQALIRAQTLADKAMERVQDEREALQKRAIAVTSEEIRVVDRARSNAIKLLEAMASVTRSSELLTKRVAEVLEATASEISPATCLKLLEQLARIQKQAIEAGDLVIKMERVRNGSPSELLDEQAKDDDASIEESAGKIARAARALQRARELGIVVMPEEPNAIDVTPRALPEQEAEVVADSAPAPDLDPTPIPANVLPFAPVTDEDAQ
jgi:hypothetical protein